MSSGDEYQEDSHPLDPAEVLQVKLEVENNEVTGEMDTPPDDALQRKTPAVTTSPQPVNSHAREDDAPLTGGGDAGAAELNRVQWQLEEAADDDDQIQDNASDITTIRASSIGPSDETNQ